MKKTKAVDKIEELRQRNGGGETKTLCYCRPAEHCHRYIIKSFIEGSSTLNESDYYSKRLPDFCIQLPKIYYYLVNLDASYPI
jgi:hypothetical protein